MAIENVVLDDMFLLEYFNGPENMRNRLEIRFYTLAMAAGIFSTPFELGEPSFVILDEGLVRILWYLYSVPYTVYIAFPIANSRKTEKS